MRRKILLVSVLVLLMLFAAAPLMSLPATAEENADEPKVETADVQAPVTIFTENFEGAFPGFPVPNWYVGDLDGSYGSDYWGSTNYRAHWDSRSGWCAQVGSHPSHLYDRNMKAYMLRPVSLSAYASVTLGYWYWTYIDLTNDGLQVMYYRPGIGWSYVDKHTGYSNGWKYSTVTIPKTATWVGFYFYSNDYWEYEGAYIDDIALKGDPGYSIHVTAWCATCGWIYMPIYMDGYWTGYTTPHDFTGLTGTHTLTAPATDANGHAFYEWSTGSTSRTITISSGGTYTARFKAGGYSVTISAFCYTEYKYISVPIIKDGSPSGYSTPYTFTFLSGTHTFTVPSTDAMGHPFKQWEYSDETSTTITVSSAGEHYATYQAAAQPPRIEIWTDKTTYARGQTLKAYYQGFNPGPATTVKVTAWIGLPGGGKYMLETVYTGTLPASYTSPVYTWKSFTVPTSAAPGTYSVNAEMRNPTTNALIDSDTYYFTIT